VGAHLIKRSYFDPHWEKKAMQASLRAFDALRHRRQSEKAGELRADGPGRGARDLHPPGLVGGEIAEEYARRWAFYTHNHQLMLDIETLEHKSRRPDVLVDDELIFAFYDRSFPKASPTARASTSGGARPSARTRNCSTCKREDLMRHEAAGVTTEAFPHQLKLGGVEFTRSPTTSSPVRRRDGVTLTVPLAQLNQIPARAANGWCRGCSRKRSCSSSRRCRRRSAPSWCRCRISPPNLCRAGCKKIGQAADPGADPLHPATRGLNARGWEITPDAFRPDALPAHFSFNFKLSTSTAASSA
jgi:ATP-dependent helicase HrpA